MINVPAVINKADGIKIFGKVTKSLIFTTDISIIRNTNADAVIAVYPFTPQPIITHAIMLASDKPVFCGVGGGTTKGKRVVNLALDAEFQGAVGVVVNSPTQNETIAKLNKTIDIPIVVTVVSENENINDRIKNGATILNVSGASQTPFIVEKIRKDYPNIPIIATGGQTDQSIIDTINAGANSITWTPPCCGEIFKNLMNKYRN